MRAIAVIAASFLAVSAASARQASNPVAAAAYAVSPSAAAANPHLTRVGQDIVNALKWEQKALKDVENRQATNDPKLTLGMNEIMQNAANPLSNAHDELKSAVDAGEIDATDAGRADTLLQQAQKIDFRVPGDVSAKRLKFAVSELRQAIQLKQRAHGLIVDDLTNTAKRCSATKEFDVYAVPSGYAGAYADVYPHGVPRSAKHIKVSFVDLATGKSPAPELFPGQTWTATNKGFLPDGRLDIHVDVSGTGFGAEDANKKEWKVVVTYDC